MGANLTGADYGVMVSYLVAVVVIGVLCGKQEKTTKNFLLGGGNMNYMLLGISCLMAALSAISLVSMPCEVFNHGCNLYFMFIASPFLMVLSCMIFMKFYFKLGSFTPFEYLERRFSPGVRTLVTVLVFYSRLFYSGMVLFTCSKIFEGAAGWPAWVTILVLCGVSIPFSAAGGLKAVVWTDLMQFIVLVGGLFCILGALYINVDGGFIGGIALALKDGHGFSEFSNPEFFTLSPYVRLCFWLIFFNNLTAIVGSMSSDQMTVQRLLASGSYKQAVKTQWVNALFNMPTTIILFVIGWMVYAYYAQNPEIVPKSGDTALFEFISNKMPVPLPGLVIAGMMAAVISTLNAVYNSLATVYCKEFHVRYFRPQTSEAGQVKVSRIATVVLGLISCSLGLTVCYSAEWLRQSVVEAGVIFNAFDGIIIPAFFYAVLSRKSSTLMVWMIAGTLWGSKWAMLTWYITSTDAWNLYQDAVKAGGVADPGMAGVIRPYWALGLLVLSLVILFIWSRISKKFSKIRQTVMMTGSIIGGYAVGVLFWSMCSYIYCQEEPQALSFNYMGLIMMILYIVMGAAWMLFGKVQPVEKWQGLTLFDKGEVIQLPKNN